MVPFLNGNISWKYLIHKGSDRGGEIDKRQTVPKTEKRDRKSDSGDKDKDIDKDTERQRHRQGQR